MIRRKRAVVKATGARGSATGTAVVGSPSSGPVELLAVRLDYSGLPGTTDVTLSDAGPVSGEVTRITSSNTDVTVYPRRAASRSDGGASALTEVPPLVEGLRVDVAEGDPDGTVTVDAVFRA